SRPRSTPPRSTERAGTSDPIAHAPLRPAARRSLVRLVHPREEPRRDTWGCQASAVAAALRPRTPAHECLTNGTPAHGLADEGLTSRSAPRDSAHRGSAP